MDGVDPKVEATLKAEIEAKLKTQHESDVAAIKSAKDKEISELRKAHDDLTSKMAESDTVMAKLTGEDAAKKKQDASDATRAKLIKEGVPEETLKFAETEREMNMLAQIWKDTRSAVRSTRFDTGTGLPGPSGKPALKRDGTHFKDLQTWAEAEQSRVRTKYGI